VHLPQSDPPYAIQRLAALGPLDTAARNALERAVASAYLVRARSELLSEGEEISSPCLIVQGWAARTRMLSDGRRQFLNFLLPGDLVGLYQHDCALAVSAVVALTDVKLCRAPSGDTSPALEQVYAVSKAFEEAYLLSQITRLGRLNAHERICDVLLELLERLELAGQSQGGTFDFPLTQEMLGDAVGLTPVHVNRMVQQARREGWIEWRGRRIQIKDTAALADRLGRSPTRVQGR